MFYKAFAHVRDRFQRLSRSRAPSGPGPSLLGFIFSFGGGFDPGEEGSEGAVRAVGETGTEVDRRIRIPQIHLLKHLARDAARVDAFAD